jgi:probable rRNA maturation factor
MNESIHFFTEKLQYSIRNKKRLREWITDTALAENAIAGEINFVLCDDDFLAEINVKYLKNNTLTDIITFPMMEDESVISGDIFISLPRIQENAKNFRQKIEEELHRVMIHGILHLLGYGDSSAEEKKAMTRKENFYLKKLSGIV